MLQMLLPISLFISFNILGYSYINIVNPKYYYSNIPTTIKYNILKNNHQIYHNLHQKNDKILLYVIKNSNELLTHNQLSNINKIDIVKKIIINYSMLLLYPTIALAIPQDTLQLLNGYETRIPNYITWITMLSTLYLIQYKIYRWLSTF